MPLHLYMHTVQLVVTSEHFPDEQLYIEQYACIDHLLAREILCGDGSNSLKFSRNINKFTPRLAP